MKVINCYTSICTCRIIKKKKTYFVSQYCFCYMQGNIEHVYQLSRKVRRPKVEYVEIVPMDGMAVQNYSSHTFNSTELAYRILRQKMAEVKHR